MQFDVFGCDRYTGVGHPYTKLRRYAGLEDRKFEYEITVDQQPAVVRALGGFGFGRLAMTALSRARTLRARAATTVNTNQQGNEPDHCVYLVHRKPHG